MLESNEYIPVLRHFYGKSLIMHDPSDFHPVLRFFFMDALAHIDYTLGTLAYNFMSVRNEMSREYLRWRIDEEEKGDRKRFPGFIAWLKGRDPEAFEALPMVWKYVYDPAHPARYMSFRLVLEPDSNSPIPAGFFLDSIEEFFAAPFLRSLYADSGLAKLLDEYLPLSPAETAPPA